MIEGAAAFSPVFDWDPLTMRVVAANRDALSYWGESSVPALAARVFAPADWNAAAIGARVAMLSEGTPGGWLTLRPARAAVHAWAEAATVSGVDGRRLIRLHLSRIGDERDAPAARAAMIFEAGARPQAALDAAGGTLERNAADRLAFASGAISARFAAPEEAARLIAEAREEGAASREALLVGVDGALRRARVSLTRLPDPSSGGGAFLMETEDLQPAAPGAPDAAIIHDLRAPLNAIQGFAQFIERAGDDLNAEQRAAYLGDIREAGDRMLNLIDQLLVERVDAAPPRADLEAAAHAAARRHGLRAEAAGRVISVVGAGPLTVRMSNSDLGRVLDNLIDNALRHGGGAIAIELTSAPRGVTVCDDGPGAAAAVIAAAMTAEAPVAAGGRVGGIGLAGARRLAEAAGGALTVETAPGAGFTARLTLPE